MNDPQPYDQLGRKLDLQLIVDLLCFLNQPTLLLQVLQLISFPSPQLNHPLVLVQLKHMASRKALMEDK